MASDTLTSAGCGPTGESGEEPSVRLFETARELALEAEERACCVMEHHLDIGGRRLRLRFAGPAMSAPMSRALMHLAADGSGEADFTVRLWDSSSSELHMPPPPWSEAEYRQCGEISRFIGERIYTHFDGAQQALTIIDFERREAVYWMRSSRYIPYYEKAAPLRAFLHAWLSREHLHHVHGAAVGRPDGGVLLVGNKGAGKSNTALACLQSSLFYAGDDHCLVGLDPEPMIYSIYSSGKTYRDDVARLPFLGTMMDNPDGGHEGKALYFLNEHVPARITAGFPLRAVLLPQVTGQRETGVRPASPMDALRLIAPDAMLKWPSLGRQTFRTLTTVFRATPCFVLDAGTDVSRIPEAIDGVLDAVSVGSTG